MILPAYVSQCITALEEAGYSAYAVGGCVRDRLLGLEPQDYDLCTSALPEQIQQVFQDRGLVLSGVKHGTVGVIFPEGVVEITTYRTEGGYTDGRHPDWVRFVDQIQEDLARRDFTVNAMAWSPLRGLQDPFGGRQDLEQGILRTVGCAEDRFREDSLRILRGARFAAKYRLTPQEQTYEAMVRLTGLMEDLARERVYSELCKLITVATAEDLIRYAPVITQVIPELVPAVGFDQRCRYHVYDLYTHIAHVTAAVPQVLNLRWAALLHDVGKLTTFTLDEEGQGHFYGHAQESARLADQILTRLKAPTNLRLEVVQLIRYHMSLIDPQRKLVRRWLGRLGEEGLQSLLTLQEADMGSKGTDYFNPIPQLQGMIRELMAEEGCMTLRQLAVNGHDLMALGIPAGKSIGRCLTALLDAVLDERLPNDREELLQAAIHLYKEASQ